MYHSSFMKSNTHFSKKTTTTSILSKQPLTSTHILNDVEENLELTPRELDLLEQLETRHLAYADVDLHY